MTEQKEEKKKVFCPYCDEEIRNSNLPYCRVCGLTTFTCPGCGKTVARENEVCPHCGAEIKG
jgi:predicted amidophosphoribosyltransferase